MPQGSDGMAGTGGNTQAKGDGPFSGEPTPNNYCSLAIGDDGSTMQRVFVMS